jgi:hypothetical protein
MGLGGVKLVAAIGAFTGWAGAVFTIPAASVIASPYGIATLVIGRKEWSSQIPFGPVPGNWGRGVDFLWEGDSQVDLRFLKRLILQTLACQT